MSADYKQAGSQTLAEINRANDAAWNDGNVPEGPYSKPTPAGTVAKKAAHFGRIALAESKGHTTKLALSGKERDTRHPKEGGQEVAHGEQVVTQHDGEKPKRRVHLARRANRSWRGSMFA